MINSGSLALVPRAVVPLFKSPVGQSAGVIEDELAWRARPVTPATAFAEPKIVATRWRSLEQGICEVSADTPHDEHLVAIVMRNENVRFSIGGRIIHDGAAISGMLQVTEPNVSARCIFRGPYDVIHIHVPNRIIAELGREISGGEVSTLHTGGILTQDPVTERLGRALLAAEEAANPLAQFYADCVSTAIVARLLSSTRRAPSSTRSKVAELARWRLRRVTEYVDANLAEPVSLADLAAAAGLTRMHFAAQFRAATGLPPHEYLLRRRIERAQEMLVENREALVDIALSVGFQTQSHFTSVFKRFVGQPPHAWQRRQGGRYTAPQHRDQGQSERRVAA